MGKEVELLLLLLLLLLAAPMSLQSVGALPLVVARAYAISPVRSRQLAQARGRSCHIAQSLWHLQTPFFPASTLTPPAVQKHWRRATSAFSFACFKRHS